MAQIREIKKRIGAVKTIARITKTMQMIATAKFTSALQKAESSKPYAACLDDMVRQAAGAAEDTATKSPKIDAKMKASTEAAIALAKQEEEDATALEQKRSVESAERVVAPLRAHVR